MTTTDLTPRRTTTRSLLQRAAAVCSAGAAAIHFAVAGSHFSQWWLFGVFFLLLAAFQAVWAMLCWQPVKHWILLSGVLVNLATLALWAVTRTTGLPFGPTPGVAEVVGVADLICAVLEVGAGVLAVVVLVGLTNATQPTRIGARTGRLVTAAVATVVLIGTGTAIAMPKAHEHGTEAAAHEHETTTAGHAHGNGERHDMAELPDVSTATTAQTDAAAALLQKTIAATAKYRDVAVAKAAGFDLEAAIAKRAKKIDKVKPGAAAKFADAPIKSLHVPNTANRADGRVVDPDAPETLIYSRDAKGNVLLIGVMFTAEKTEPPASYEPYLRWHFHANCIGDGTKVDSEDGTCPTGTTLRESGYMTHVWFVAPDQLQYAFAMSAPSKQVRAYQASLN